MRKRGEVQSSVIKYTIIAFGIILISLLGFKMISTIMDKHCSTEIKDFQIKLSELGDEVSSGEIRQKKLSMPCGADRIYFVNKEQKAIDFFSGAQVFKSYPEISHSIENNAGDNVFIIKDNEVIKSFNAGSLDFIYPYHSCMIPRSDKIDFFLEGLGKRATVIPGCSQPDCTSIPEIQSEQEAISILNEFTSIPDCGYCPESSEISSYLEKYKETLPNLAISRKLSYCQDSGLTTVEITIDPEEKMEHFVFFENISKDCIDDLRLYLTEIFGGGEGVSIAIKDDPVIVWAFEELDEKTTIGYRLNITLDEECRKQLEGLGLSLENLCEPDCALPEPCKHDSDCGSSEYLDEFQCDGLEYEKRFISRKCHESGSCLTRDQWHLDTKCSSKPSERVGDESNSYEIAGKVLDYDACKDNKGAHLSAKANENDNTAATNRYYGQRNGCVYTEYPDSCSGSILTEFSVAGASYTKKTVDCSTFGGEIYCDSSTGWLMKRTWGCGNGICSDAAVQDSGHYRCPNGCSGNQCNQASPQQQCADQGREWCTSTCCASGTTCCGPGDCRANCD